MTTHKPLDQRLADIERATEDLADAVRHSASKRSTIAIGVALAVFASLLVLAVVERSISRHGDCVRGNEVRAAIRISDGVSQEAFLQAIDEIFSAGRPPDAQARIDQVVAGMRDSIQNNPDLLEARKDLDPRKCDYLPF